MREYIDKLKEIETLVELSIGTTMTEEKATDIFAVTNDLMCKVKKLNKADVGGRSEQCCSPTDGFYLGTTCPHCNKPFRKYIK